MRHFVLLLALAFSPLLKAEGQDPEYFPHTDADLSPPAMDLVNEAQKAVLRLDFAGALSDCAQAETMAPDHPLPLVMDVGCRLYQIQEDIDADREKSKDYKDFDAKEDQLIAMASARERLYPKDPFPKLQLGAAYGCRGLVNLYRKSYLQSYEDGKRGVDYLQKAIAIDPEQYNAYMGLGQFEYYCARLNGLLQFFLDLQGDEKEGLRKLELCASKGTYSVWACRAFLTSVLIYDQRDWKTAAPYIDQLYNNFPQNYRHVRMAATFAQGNGMDKALSRDLMEKVCKQWDGGWRPPDYVKNFDIAPARLALARYYLGQGQIAEAKAHLLVLSKAEDREVASEAQALLKKLAS